jgi:DNA-directed RNA polymerase subunit M/transcription elongation factor TFIIS
MEQDLWKFKKYSNLTCEDCGKNLQIRERDGKEIICCSSCDYSENKKVKRVRRKEDVEEPVVEPRRQFRPVTKRT